MWVFGVGFVVVDRGVWFRFLFGVRRAVRRLFFGLCVLGRAGSVSGRERVFSRVVVVLFFGVGY